MRKSIEKPRGLDDVSDKTKPWELTEIVDRVQCRVVTMPDGMGPGNKVVFISTFLHIMYVDLMLYV